MRPSADPTIPTPAPEPPRRASDDSNQVRVIKGHAVFLTATFSGHRELPGYGFLGRIGDSQPESTWGLTPFTQPLKLYVTG